MSRIRRIRRGTRGQDMVEYALLAAFISIVALLTLRSLGPILGSHWKSIRRAFVTSNRHGPPPRGPGPTIF